MAILNTSVKLVNRLSNGSFKFRKAVPADCRAALGFNNWVKVWKAGTSTALIEFEATQMVELSKRQIAEARGEVLGDTGRTWAEEIAVQCLADPTKRYQLMALWHREGRGDMGTAETAAIAAMENKGKVPAVSPSLSAAYAQDCERYGADRLENTNAVSVKSFIASQGDLDIFSITRDHVAAWKIACKTGDKPQKAGTINRRLASLRAILNRTFLDLDGSEDRSNPFNKQSEKDTVAAVDKRQPLSADHIAKLDAYLASSNTVDRDAKNALNIIRNSGAGPAEIAALAVADVKLDGPVPFIHIRANGVRGLKNDARARKVPLIGLSLEAVQDALSAATGANLFNSLPNGKRGVDLIGRHMNEVIKAAGIEDRTSYGLRHTFAEAMRVSGAREDLQRRLLGHAGQSTKDRTYGASGASLVDMQAAITSALPHLGHFDDGSC